MGGINLDIPEDIHTIFKRKYPRNQRTTILELIKSDIGWTDNFDNARLSEIDTEIADLKKEKGKLISKKESYYRKRNEILKDSIDKIKQLFDKGVGKSWKDSDDPAPKLPLIGLEGYTEGDVWRVLNE